MEVEVQKAKGENVDGGRRVFRLRVLPFAFCLLPFALMLALLPGFHFARRPAPAPPSEAEADGLLLRAARDSLDGRDGVVLVMDAQTGRVRALAGGRAAFEEATPPGSAVKPFTMLAALRTGSLSADERLSCRGHYEHEGFKIDCSHPRYRRAFGPAQALANSCNYYFARAARALDAAAYERTLRDFGFGTPTGGGDDGRESPGLLPAEAPGVAEMLGESERIRVSPAQLASAYAALFNGGRLLAPRPARAEGFAPMVRARVEVAPAQRALLLAGMRGAVAYGTASNSGLATLPVYAFGKTGTSTPQDGWRSQGWFVGFAADAKEGEGGASSPGAEPREVPPESVRLLVLVFLKRSRGSDAAKLARPVFEAYARTLGRGPAEEEAGPSESSPVDDARAAGPSSLGGEAAGRALRVRLSREDATASLALEDYVFGVLAAEGSVESEPEALKALAVAARTYAVRNLGRHARDRFDLCDTTHCQRFTPVRDETARPEFYELARRAVRETEGEVLREPSGRVAESYFSAACGGATADLSKLWGAAHAPAHLRGVRDDFCSGAAETWADVIPAEQLTRALRADERSDVGGHVAGVRVVRRDRTGRAELVELEGARRRRLRGWDFKIIVGRTLGWGVLKSSRFEVTRAGSSFVFRGRGFGHGLGLCQAGAHVSAGRGASYRQILAHYFPGAGLGALRDADFGARRGSPGARSDESGAVEGRAVESGVVESRAADDSRRAVEDSGHSLFQTASYLVGEAAPRARPAAAGGVEHYQLRSEHFRLSCPARVARRDAEGLLRSLEAWRADVVRRLERAGVGGGLPDIEVFVHETTGDFVGATGQPAWVAGSTEGRRVDLQPLDVLRRRGVLGTAPRHELIHAALGAAGAGRAPRWLAEGLCAYAAGEGPSLSRRATGERIPADELERRLARPGSAEEMRALYAAAYREVSALIRREGEPAVWRRALR